MPANDQSKLINEQHEHSINSMGAHARAIAFGGQSRARGFTSLRGLPLQSAWTMAASIKQR